MASGTVKWFNDQKGFGFITPNGGGKDMFVHYSDILGQGARKVLQEGQEVTFEAQQGPKGPKAVKVAVVSSVRRG